MIDPDTGQPITPEDDGYETPVSPILGGTAAPAEGTDTDALDNQEAGAGEE